jgi:hypothetical protein
MRGFYGALFFYTLLLYTLLTISYFFHVFYIIPHQGINKVYEFITNSAEASLKGSTPACYMDLPTFGKLDKLDHPVVKRC